MRRIFTRSQTLKRARTLRREETEAEKRLWGALRNSRLQGWKFRRQVSVGPFIADFLCEKGKLIVEVDGVTHGEAHQVRYDEGRTAYLQARGFRVFRCFNMDIFENLTGVCDGILLALNGP